MQMVVVLMRFDFNFFVVLMKLFVCFKKSLVNVKMVLMVKHDDDS